MTEYSPDQMSRLVTAPAPHTSAETDTRLSNNLAMKQSTVEKHPSQQLSKKTATLEPPKDLAPVAANVEEASVNKQPNFFKQWTEQTELTAMVVNGR